MNEITDLVKLPINELKAAPATDAPAVLPDAVIRFCDSVNSTFAATATQLEATAKAMHDAANDMEKRAAALRDAAPDVSKQVHDWISYERESRDRHRYYSSLFIEN